MKPPGTATLRKVIRWYMLSLNIPKTKTDSDVSLVGMALFRQLILENQKSIYQSRL